MHANPVVENYLRDVENDLDAARRLAQPPVNRLAAYHLEQAAEKLIKAVRLDRGLTNPIGHDLRALVEELSDTDGLKPKLAVLGPLTSYATSFRYATHSRQLTSPLTKDEIERKADEIARLKLDVLAELGRRS